MNFFSKLFTQKQSETTIIFFKFESAYAKIRGKDKKEKNKKEVNHDNRA